MNAMLTWWGVSVAIVQNGHVGTAIVSSTIMTKAIPIFVAVMVWLIRVLIIGTFSIAGERLFTQDTTKQVRSYTQAKTRTTRQPVTRVATARRAAPKPTPRAQAGFGSTVEPTYHNLASANPQREQRFDGRERRTQEF